MKRARRYVVVIQAPGGYPARGEPMEAAPSAPPPAMHSAVLEADHEQLEAEAAALEAKVERLTTQLRAALADA